jgi:hypothetical protein
MQLPARGELPKLDCITGSRCQNLAIRGKRNRVDSVLARLCFNCGVAQTSEKNQTGVAKIAAKEHRTPLTNLDQVQSLTQGQGLAVTMLRSGNHESCRVF